MSANAPRISHHALKSFEIKPSSRPQGSPVSNSYPSKLELSPIKSIHIAGAENANLSPAGRRKMISDAVVINPPPRLVMTEMTPLMLNVSRSATPSPNTSPSRRVEAIALKTVDRMPTSSHPRQPLNNYSQAPAISAFPQTASRISKVKEIREVQIDNPILYFAQTKLDKIILPDGTLL